jgi:hypothetical protein
LDGENFTGTPCQLNFSALEFMGVARQKYHFPVFARNLPRQNKTEPTRAAANQDYFPGE